MDGSGGEGGGEVGQQKRRRAFWSCITDYWALMETAICRKRSKTVAPETASCLEDVENFYKAYKRTCVSGHISVGWTWLAWVGQGCFGREETRKG